MVHDGHSTRISLSYNLPASCLEDSRRQKLVDLLCKVLNVSFQRKVARINKFQHQVLHISSECLGAGLDEDYVILAPDSEHWHATLAEVLVPLRVELKIRAVVVEERELSFGGALAGEQRGIEGVRLRRDAGLELVGHAVRVLPFCRTELQEGQKRLSLGSRRGERGQGPVLAERLPEFFAQSVFVCIAVLGDDRCHALGVPYGDAECRRGL